MSTAAKRTTIEYPTGDGKPMAETDLHRELLLDSIKTLEYFFANTEDVYVSGNLLIYYEEGNKRKHVSPDTFVVFGVPKHKRKYFLTWEEAKLPRVLFEYTSKSTRREDIQIKKDLYRDVFKAREYFLFDPFGEYLKPRLQGFRRSRGDWKPIPLIDGKMVSEVLGLELHLVEGRLRFFDPKAGRYLAGPEERAETAEERAETAEERAETAEERAEKAERLSRLAQEQATEANRRAAQIEAEKRRLEEETERLRRELETLRSGQK